MSNSGQKKSTITNANEETTKPSTGPAAMAIKIAATPEDRDVGVFIVLAIQPESPAITHN
jgi:hypothetical protein